MPYELRRSGTAPIRFETEPDAIAAAKRAVHDDPAAEIELIDLATGKAAAPGATRNWREELKTKL